jgi:hypothetical protein
MASGWYPDFRCHHLSNDCLLFEDRVVASEWPCSHSSLHAGALAHTHTLACPRERSIQFDRARILLATKGGYK